MPYIKHDRRVAIQSGALPQTEGELNYAFTLQAKRYCDEHKLNYAAINDVLGAFEGAKLEFYRRVAAPYEDTKIAENGDVY